MMKCSSFIGFSNLHVELRKAVNDVNDMLVMKLLDLSEIYHKS